jgi:hypothetical protein
MSHANSLAASTSPPDDRPAAIANTIVRVPAHVVFRIFASETLVLNLQTGLYHRLNATGGRMLELLGELGLVRAVVDRLAAEYERDADRLTEELWGYCVALASHGLLELHPPA